MKILSTYNGNWVFNGYIVRKMGTFRYYPRPMLHKVIAIIKKVLRR